MEKILLWKNRSAEGPPLVPFLETHLLPGEDIRPAVLVIPGGGYISVCADTEGAPVARAFNRLGFHAFVLHYRCGEKSFPFALEDAVRAMKIIRGRAQEWHVDARTVAACGFSAGGHLAGALGIYPEEADASGGDAFDGVDPRPDALILSYPVACFEPWSEPWTIRNFCNGEVTEEKRARFSLDKRVDAKTPPVFLWHTVRDQMVSFRNSVVLAEALARAGKICSLHLYPLGEHGMLLGLDTEDVHSWIRLVADFLRTVRRAENPEYLTHYTNRFQSEAEKRQGYAAQ